jgi:hypothetical protein
LSIVGEDPVTVTRVLAFHAEKLHDDQVWRRIAHVARWLPQHGIKATFFVYPFRAQVANRDITDRVHSLAALGHEIGQHTHFYAGTKVDKPEKVDDLSETNISYCLHRDFRTLHQMGFLPKAFTAGSWFVNGTVWDTLVELGFAYDCSAQFPKPVDMPKSPYNCWLRSPQIYRNPQGRLICLPTTCSLGEWFKWGRKVKTEGKMPYQIVYLHDDDLLSPHYYFLVWCFLLMVRGRAPKGLASLAEQYSFEQEEPRCL